MTKLPHSKGIKINGGKMDGMKEKDKMQKSHIQG